MPMRSVFGPGRQLAMFAILAATTCLITPARLRASLDPRTRPRSAAEARSTRYERSAHWTRFVKVAPGVRLEVLDWGGTGPTLVLLTGLGDTAHIFDDFAARFTDRFHVIGITRRGFGRSSRPSTGYDIATRARDDLRVLDRLGVRKAFFVAHSIACSELSQIAATRPDRVRKLVYLDGADLTWGGWKDIPQPPPAPELDDAEVQSVRRLAAALARDDGYRKPLAAVASIVRTDREGHVIGAASPPEISRMIHEGLQPSRYDRIRAPTLAYFNDMRPDFRMPYYPRLGPAARAEFDRSIEQLSPWYQGHIKRFESEVRGARVVKIPDANHYLFITDEAQVVPEVRRFLLED
ncbi:MAG: alpha/beta hydrolase [Isosphaeraceae bacterium]